MLDAFRQNNINLTYIDSRPNKKQNWEYNFFIDTQGHVDSRTAPTAFRYTAMAPSHRAQVVRATRLLGLHYAAWDGIVGAEDGRLYLLDCNPGPSLMWIGPDFREIVCRGLASYLVAWAQSGSLRQARAAVQAWSP